MVFWKRVLKALRKSNQEMQSIYDIFMTEFRNHVFSEMILDGVVHRTTYHQLDEQAKKIAYQVNKIKKNTHPFVAIYMENSPLWAATFWGVLMAGCKPILLNTRQTNEELEQVIKEAQVDMILSDRDTFGILVDPWLKESNQIEQVNWENEFAIYTSGTTGKSKICVYNGIAVSAQIGMTEYIIKTNKSIIGVKYDQIRILSLLPFYHIFGFMTNFIWFSFFGRTLVFTQSLDPKYIQYVIKRLKVTHFFAIPLIWNQVAKRVLEEAKKNQMEEKLQKALRVSLAIQRLPFGKFIAKKMFKKVREQLFGETPIFLISGGSHIREETLLLLNGLGYPLYNGYGMTETGITSVELTKNPKIRIKGSVGKPFSYLSYQISPEGILMFKGPSLYTGLLKNGKVSYRDQTKWFKTNDLFMEDKNHKLYMMMRVDDLIIGENGENINPDHLEHHFIMSSIEQISIFGLKKASNDEIYLIVEIKKHISEEQEHQVIKKLFEINDILRFSERFHHLYITKESLPLVNMKVQRSKIRERILNRYGAYQEVFSNHYEQIQEIENIDEVLLYEVRTIFSKILEKEVEQIKSMSHFMNDLGGTSLEYFTLMNHLNERFNIEFNLGEVFLTTPIQFAEYIKKKRL